MQPVEYRIGEDDYINFGLLNTAKAFRIFLSVFCGYLAFVLAAIAVSGGSTILWGMAVLTAFLLGLLCNNRFRALPRLLKASYREDAQIKEPVLLTYDADGYVAESAASFNRREWADMVRWDENDRIFVVFSNRQLGHIFPKDQVPAHVIDDIRNHMVASGLPERGKLRK